MTLGRPRTHTDNAEKQRAYRQRHKALRNSPDDCVKKFLLLRVKQQIHRTEMSVYSQHPKVWHRREAALFRALLMLYRQQPQAIENRHLLSYPKMNDLEKWLLSGLSLHTSLS